MKSGMTSSTRTGTGAPTPLPSVATFKIEIGVGVLDVQKDLKAVAERLDIDVQSGRIGREFSPCIYLPSIRLPGKLFVPFEPVWRQGRQALQVRADRSVSVLRQRFEPGLAAVDALHFSWQVDALPAGADLRDAGATDAPVRILLAFEGDRSTWSARTHRLSELSHLLTGEPLPYATLSYVWSPNDPPGTVLNNPRTDRIRKLVVDSGTAHLGQWRDHRRDVRADFIRAFGEAPGPLVAVAVMTETDNTGSHLRAWYGPMRLVDLSRSRQVD